MKPEHKLLIILIYTSTRPGIMATSVAYLQQGMKNYFTISYWMSRKLGACHSF